MNTEKQDPSNRTEPQSNYNRNITDPNHTKQRLNQEGKMNIEIIKRIMSEKKDYISIAKKRRLEKNWGRN